MSKRSRREAAGLPQPGWLFLILVLAALGLAALGGLALVGQTRTSEAWPGRLVAVQSMIDLGRVPLDRVVEARFILENTGGSPVRIVAAPTVKTLEGC